MPSLRVHTEGESVHFGDRVILRHVASGLSLCVAMGASAGAWSGSPWHRRDLYATRRNEAAPLQVRLFRSWRDHEQRTRRILGGQPVRLLHKEGDGALIATVGLPLDTTGDGVPDAVGFDTTGDGFIDGVDTTGDGKVDRKISRQASSKVSGVLPAPAAGGTPASTGTPAAGAPGEALITPALTDVAVATCTSGKASSHAVWSFERADVDTGDALGVGGGNVQSWDGVIRLIHASSGCALALDVNGPTAATLSPVPSALHLGAKPPPSASVESVGTSNAPPAAFAPRPVSSSPVPRHISTPPAAPAKPANAERHARPWLVSDWHERQRETLFELVSKYVSQLTSSLHNLHPPYLVPLPAPPPAYP